MEERMKALALKEFGTLEGVTIQYTVDRESGRVTYCLSRKSIPRPRPDFI